MGQTIAEKVLAAHSGSDCAAGDIVVASVDFCMAQDGTSTMMIRELENLGFEHPKTALGMGLVLDHNAPCPSVEVARVHLRIRGFADKNRIPLYETGCGVCHQVVPESGKVLPGSLVVGADSHTCTYGALNACSTGLGSADVAAAAYAGKLWFKVPETYSIIAEGQLPDRVGAKDLMLKVIGRLTADGATYKSVEFTGASVASMGMDGRFTIANMAVEMGAKFCPFSFDEKTSSWLSERGFSAGAPVSSDPDAHFEKRFDFDAADVVPQVARPHSVDNVCDASSLRGTKVQQAFLGTCTNGRLSDLEAAARLMRGRTVNRGVRFIVAPASRTVLLDAMASGVAAQLVKAGAVFVAPGCGPCVGTHAGVPSDGENVISTANRNFKGRMGNNRDVGIFLGSPETIAASAITGEITDPREV
ncbi:MAG: aconitase/3-isopropylmalate dehydratase large subunit family protein [Thermoplasmata archaeon]|jgi:3-isopropylmalate/(R)-2-methylmalate dehydratase large subunit|nr:aconitase/3-isopropylmalate dehydratase large subunit family protein [Thermoplasmata archaeon]